MAMTQKTFLISGRVQGVGFRAFTQQKAAALDLTGWVRNIQDGRVEAVARGQEKDLERFESLLWQGPSGAQVLDVQTDSAEGVTVGDGTARGFEVKYD